MFKKIFPLLRDIAIVIGGNIIYACGVAFFVLPGGLITGGTTGIALFIQHLFGVPISTFVLCFNAVMFLLGLFVLGRKFAATTILSTFVYPIALEMIQRLSKQLILFFAQCLADYVLELRLELSSVQALQQVVWTFRLLY